MKLNVGPSDLAMVVSPDLFAGATCTVVERGDGAMPPEYVQRHGSFWVVRFPRPMSWSRPAPGVDPRQGAIPDAHLRRIAGPDIATNWWTGQGVKAPERIAP